MSIIEGFNGIDADQAWGAFLMLLVAAIAILIFSYAFSTKKVVGYYLGSSEYGVTGSVSCVWANWQWNPDQKVFCTTDVKVAIEAIKELNQAIK